MAKVGGGKSVSMTSMQYTVVIRPAAASAVQCWAVMIVIAAVAMDGDGSG